MTAYVKNANGAWNSPTLWTPNGTPGSADTVTLGAFTTTIPTGYTAQCGGITSFSGSGSGSRSTLEISGTLELYGTATQGTWSTLSFVGAGKLDLRGFNWEVSYTDGSGRRVEVISDGTATCEIYSSTTLSIFGAPGGGVVLAHLNLNKFYISNVQWEYGGAWEATNNFILQNGTFYNCGRITNWEYLDDSSDWIVENVDFRGSQSGEYQKVWLYCRDKGGTITGIRRFKKVTFDYTGGGSSAVRLRYFPAVMTVDGVYFRSCYVEGLSVAATFNNFFAGQSGVVGEGGFPIREGVITHAVDNPHTMVNLCNDLQGFYIESNQPSNSTDAGDHFILPNGGTTSIKYGIINDNWGGVALNALGVSLTGTHTLEHCTFVVDTHASDYGILARNENSGVFNTSATVTVRSNIVHARSNPSGFANIRVFNLETAGDDQIDTIDYNVINACGSSAGTLYYGVTSATKGSIGSQTGWGLNDKINTNPNFVAPTRNVQSWASQYGATDYDSSIIYVIDSVNGYNRTTHKQTSTPGHTITELLTYIRAGYTPTNAAIATAAHDGTTIGALAYVAAVSIDSYPATIRSGSTGNAYTTTGLSAVSSITIGALSATSLSDTAGDGTHSVPSLVDGVAHQLYGTKTVTINGTGGSPTTTTQFSPLSTQSYVTLSGTLNTTNTGVLYNFSPAAAVGDQIVFDTAKGAVDAQGNYSGDYDGAQTMWHIDATDNVARSYTVTTGVAADLIVSLTGVAATAAVGTITTSLGSSPVSVTLSGVSTTATIGTITANITEYILSTSNDTLPKFITDSVAKFKKIFKKSFRKK